MRIKDDKHQWRIQGGGGVPGVVTPPLRAKHEIIISRALFMNIILYPTCLLSAVRAR